MLRQIGPSDSVAFPQRQVQEQLLPLGRLHSSDPPLLAASASQQYSCATQNLISIMIAEKKSKAILIPSTIQASDDVNCDLFDEEW